MKFTFISGTHEAGTFRMILSKKKTKKLMKKFRKKYPLLVGDRGSLMVEFGHLHYSLIK